MKMIHKELHNAQEVDLQELRFEALLDWTERLSVLVMVGSFLMLLAACLTTL
ncbi:MAG: hypothetical protein IKT58_06850 [Oscillospiraceae bacterium]|nr:hypothetical protein [Oscillospiraceae bacterium]